MRHMRHIQRRGSRSDRAVGVAAFVAAVACSGLVLAQPPAGPPPPTVGQIQGSTQPTFRGGVTLVTTDVIVRDRDGVFMPDLTKDDFRIFEDGVEQEIASLVLIHGGRVYNQLLPTPRVQEGIVLPTSRPSNETAGRIFVLFVDDLHLVTSSTPRVRQVFKQIADTLVHEGDLFGIISTGPSSIAVDMTYNRARLYESMEKIIGDGLAVRDVLIAQEGSRGPTELIYRAHAAFKTARDVLINLEQVTNRRKVFIYISNGYDFDPFPESRYNTGALADIRNGLTDEEYEDFYGGLPDPATDPFDIERRQRVFSDSDLSVELAELTRIANRVNTTIYTFDPRGLVASPDIDDALPVREWNEHIFKTQNSLRVLSELTGGLAVVNRNDFTDALQEIDAETSDYYIIGFYTSNPDPTIRTRRLEVEIPEQDDITIRARTHYTLPRGPA